MIFDQNRYIFHLIRGQKVMLDRDLAELYEVETKQLKRAVRRNIDRFPADFMFELTKAELENCFWKKWIVFIKNHSVGKIKLVKIK